MTTKLAINGFGRIGRSVLRALMDRPAEGLEVVAINDLAPLATLAHLFEFDSIHGRYPFPVRRGDGTLDVGRGAMRVTSERAPENLPWSDVDIVLECTGTLRAPADTARHLQNGAGRVLLSAPAKGEMKTIVFGVNDAEITADDRLLSNGSCTTNCLVPVAHVLHEAFGIKRGHMTTVHAYNGNQPLHDANHADLYRARAAALSMIPTTTGAATSLGDVLPQLAGRITGTAVRVPAPNVSCCDLTVEVTRAVTPALVRDAMVKAAQGSLQGVLAVEDRPLVSIDFNHTSPSAIFAADQTNVMDETMLRVLAWYDNEWAFANRMIDVAAVMAAQKQRVPA